ncbi:MAG: hypothetical protein IPO91_26045 [Chloroflexi bacterium]|uniref:hypothetical protein n=1 Tax=Candidatus Flexifilum breve TaxID=3140694 RepID=UPI0031349637|nr:hypothetical protein [Chloroflexota bacterium]MBK9750215.1 hypothetical protein [Chloroflexota bacterium]
MNFSQKDVLLSKNHRRDLERQAAQERLARESRQTKPTSQKRSTPLWARLWSLF